MVASAKGTVLVYVGSYTRGEGEGLHTYRLNQATGALELVRATAAGKNPSFLAFHPSGKYLYAANETEQFDGKRGGAVSAFAIAPKTGELTFLNQQPTHGGAPCYVSVDQTGRYALVANYSSGSVAMYPIQAAGSLLPHSDFHQHQGTSSDPQRQEGPHAHSILPDPTNRFALAADLGLDKIMIYRLDLAAGKLVPNATPYAQVKAGAGPRHIAFHPNGRYAYVINELDETMIAFQYDASQGALRELQTLSTLPADFSGVSYCADVHVSPSGKFLYGTNRGHDSLVIYAIDEATGKLTLVGYEPTQGKFPRNFCIDPSGTFLFAANQDSDNIVSFRIDQATGKLTPTGHITQVPAPVCVKMLIIPD